MPCGPIGGRGIAHRLAWSRVHSAFRWQSSATDFVEQGAIADSQRAGCSLSIPAIGFQNAQDDLPLEVMHSFPRNLFQVDLAIDLNFRGRMSLFPGQQFAANYILRTKDDVTLDQILEFANIAGPRIPL